MIDAKTLAAYSTFRDPYQTEKDYLQDIVLESVYRDSDLMVFKGGTALCKFYGLDRFSTDIDFTSLKPGISIEEMNRLLARAVDRLNGMGYESEIAETPATNKFGTYKAELVINGPRYLEHRRPDTRQRIEVEVNTAAKLFRKPNALQGKPAYIGIRTYVALLMDLEELLAEKLRALASPKRRHRERDLYDIDFLLGKGVRLDAKLVAAKLDEAEISDAAELISDYIDQIGKTWNKLEQMVQHTPDDYKHVSKTVIHALKESKLI